MEGSFNKINDPVDSNGSDHSNYCNVYTNVSVDTNGYNIAFLYDVQGR